MDQLRIVLAFLLIIIPVFGIAQIAEEEVPLDTIKTFRKYDILPAISFSPETQLTLGVIGYRYLDLTKKDTSTIRSFVNFLAIYTTANQTIIETNYDIFTDGNKWRFRGGILYNRFPDRNYGLGNDAGVLVKEFELDENGIQDSTLVNYERYSINRITFQPAVLREIRDHLYGGLIAEFEYQYRFRILADSFEILNQGNEILLLRDNITGFRAGLGYNLIWDSRDMILNPRTGSFIDFSNAFYGGYLGSDYNYITVTLDVRKFFNPIKNQTLALRGVANFRYTDGDVLPIRGLSKIGGSTFVRGYFAGTYQDNHLIGFETEYRIPFPSSP